MFHLPETHFGDPGEENTMPEYSVLTRLCCFMFQEEHEEDEEDDSVKEETTENEFPI